MQNTIMGGGGTPYIPEGPPGGRSTCDSLSFETILQSPVVSVVSSLQVGDILPLKLALSGKTDTVEAYAAHGARAGSVHGLRLLQLIECMRNKHEFVAEVIRINGGECKVCVMHK